MLNIAIDRYAREEPGRMALVTGDGQVLDFARLAATVRTFAARLAAAGAGPGVSVMPVVDNPAVRLVLWFAALRLGAVPVLVPAPVMAEAGRAPDLLVASADQADLGPGIVIFDGTWRADGLGPPVPVREAEAGMLLSSSGSTGLPKLMSYPPGVLEARNRAMNAAAGVPNGPMLVAMNVNSGGTFRYIYRALCAGQGVVMAGGAPDETLERMTAHRIAGLVAPPPTLGDLCAAAEAGGVRMALERVETTGAALSQVMAERTEGAFGAPVTVMYGQAEAGSIAIGRPAERGHGTGLSGRLLEDVEVRFGEPVGAFAGLWVRVPKDRRIAPYLNAAGPFDDEGWLKSGDLARMDDGWLVLGGRADDVINTGGRGWLPDGIEAVALPLAGVAQVAAFGSPGPAGPDDVWLAVVAAAHFDGDRLALAVAAAMPGLPRPRVLEVGAMPLTPLGKIDRRALRRLAQKG